MLFVDILPWNFVCNFPSRPKSSLSVKFWIFFAKINFRGCKKTRIFHPKTHIFTKIKNFSLEEYVMIELRIFIDIIIFFSSIEVTVPLLGVKVVTFVLYGNPFFRFMEIVKKNRMQQNHLRLKALLCDQCQII